MATVMMNNVRLAFPVLFEPKAAKAGQKQKFSAAGIFPATHEVVPLLKAAMQEAAKAKWGDKWEEVYNGLRAGDRLAVHDGSAKSEYAGYSGNLFLNASNELRPLVIDGQRRPLAAADGMIYSGCYVNMKVEIWAQQHPEHGKRINASLMGVQFARDGERLAGGAVASADDFDEIPAAMVEAAAASGKGAAELF